MYYVICICTGITMSILGGILNVPIQKFAPFYILGILQMAILDYIKKNNKNK